MATIKLISELNIDNSTVRTVTSAERMILLLAGDLRWYGIDHPCASQWADDIEAAAMAISVTTGEPIPALMARMDTKIERSFARREREAAAHAKKLGYAV